MTWLSNAVVEHLRSVVAWPELPTERYTIVEPIGRGGMGMVFSARDAQLGRDVAIKVSNAAAPGSELDERLREEARILATLEHPGIVPIHDIGRLADGRMFYVMKLIRGETLTTHAATLASESARLGVFERLVETVAFAHSAGVVHRDLKPSNVMAGSFGEVLVLDWGVAAIVGDDSAGLRAGTRGFMAPEQHRGEVARAGPRADVYSLGALLCWLLTGDLPSDSIDHRAVRRSREDEPIPARLRSIVLRCLSPEPAARYADAGDLAADLARYRAGMPVMAHHDTRLERLGRWLTTYRTFILLVIAYLVMRAALAWLQRP